MDPESREETLQLIRDAKNGNAAALNELFDRHLDRVRRSVALRLGRASRDLSTVDDVVQSTLLKLLKRFDHLEFSSVGAFRNYLGKCVASAIAERFGNKLPVSNVTELGSTLLAETLFREKGSGPSSLARARELDERIEQELLAMEPRHRRVYRQRKVEGLSYEEIAEELEISPGNARQMVHKVVGRLRERLKEFAP